MSQCATIVTKEAGVREIPTELDPEGEGFVYGGETARCWGTLNRIAEQLQLTPLKKFEWYGKDDDQRDTGPWHDPANGLRTVSGVLRFIRQSTPEQLKPHFNERFIEQNLEWVIFDLRAYEIILRDAKEQSDPFRILSSGGGLLPTVSPGEVADARRRRKWGYALWILVWIALAIATVIKIVQRFT